MIRPDHLFPPDVNREHNADHQNLQENAEWVEAHGPRPEDRVSVAEIVRQGSGIVGTSDPAMIEPEALAAREETNLENGMSTVKATERLKEEGPNELEKPPKLGLIMLFLLQMTSFIILLLIAAAVASIVVNATGKNAKEFLSYTTGIAIFILVLLNAGIAAWTEHQAGNALEALAKLSQPNIAVIRDGEELPLPTVELVRGDIVLLQTGDVVPADIRLFEASDVKVDEKALTGEPDDVGKNTKIKEQTKLTPENMVFSGCPVVSGKCKGVVVATGMQTRIGEIAKMMAAKDSGKKKHKCGCIPNPVENQTPLQENVERLGARIGVGAIVVCIVVFGIGLAMNTKDPEYPENPSWIYMILIAVTLAVAAIPEGIPLCVTISLAIGCKDMVKENVQVRKIAAVETLGSASVICSDKTGTLTEGKMTMTKMWSCGVEYEVSGQGFNPNIGKVTRKGAGPDANNNADMGVKSTLLSAMLCCDTTLFFNTEDEEATSKVPQSEAEDRGGLWCFKGKSEGRQKVSTTSDTSNQDGKGKWDYQGNSSEAPIIVAGRKVGIPEDFATKYKRVLGVPFSSARKMMLTITDVTGLPALCDGGMALADGSTLYAVVKGAPNWVLLNCTSQLTESGTTAALSEADRERVNAVVDMYSDEALRVLAIAGRPFQQPPFDLSDEDLPVDRKFELCRQDLTLLGLVASIDPDREGVKKSVLDARGAGIRVVMITGDYLKTAVAIAKRVQILQDEDDVDDCAVDCGRLRPTGEEVYLPDKDMDEMTSKVRVFARAKPADKLQIVKSLQRQGLVSAMTGDGVNDAPALNEADIGVAMGIQGTEVAKGAAEMILTDDNFKSIVLAVAKGRAIYSGIQKFVAFIMSVHIAEVIQIFFCVVASMPLMRTPLQILFLILVTDLPPSVALGMEPAEAGILSVPPRPREEPIVLLWMWISIVINGAILSCVIIAIYIFSLQHYVGYITLNGIVDYKNSLPTPQQQDEVDVNLQLARTVAFVSLVFSENVRAYVSRSFDKPVWRDLLGNSSMQVAVLMAQVAMCAAVFIPFLSDTILGLRGVEIGGWGWGVAFIGPAGTLVLCEIFKVFTGWQKRRYERSLRKKRGDDESEDEDGEYTETSESD